MVACVCSQDKAIWRAKVLGHAAALTLECWQSATPKWSLEVDAPGAWLGRPARPPGASPGRAARRALARSLDSSLPRGWPPLPTVGAVNMAAAAASPASATLHSLHPQREREEGGGVHKSTCTTAS